MRAPNGEADFKVNLAFGSRPGGEPPRPHPRYLASVAKWPQNRSESRVLVTHPEVPYDVIANLRLVCLGLPDAYEEQAWVGTRWRIRKQIFAHVLMVDAGWAPAYAKATTHDGPICVMTFRSSLPALDKFAFTWHPFIRHGWWSDIVGTVLEVETDRDEVGGSSPRATASWRQ